MGRFLIFCALLWGGPTFADTLVLFVPSPDAVHQDLYGNFYHTAVRVQGEWWEAHPYYGVRKSLEINELRNIEGTRVLRSPMDYSVPRKADLVQLLGTPFDLHSRWGDPETFNCTELVAYVLGLDHYATPIQEEGFLIGELGLSPDRLYEQLQLDGWQVEWTHKDVCREALLY